MPLEDTETAHSKYEIFSKGVAPGDITVVGLYWGNELVVSQEIFDNFLRYCSSILL